MVGKGCVAFLACVVMDDVVDKSIRDVEVVKEFEDVLFEDLFDLLPDREMEFSIDLLLETSPVSMALYRMAPAELAALKKQLTDLCRVAELGMDVNLEGGLNRFTRIFTDFLNLSKISRFL